MIGMILMILMAVSIVSLVIFGFIQFIRAFYYEKEVDGETMIIIVFLTLIAVTLPLGIAGKICLGLGI